MYSGHTYVPSLSRHLVDSKNEEFHPECIKTISQFRKQRHTRIHPVGTTNESVYMKPLNAMRRLGKKSIKKRVSLTGIIENRTRHALVLAP